MNDKTKKWDLIKVVIISTTKETHSKNEKKKPNPSNGKKLVSNFEIKTDLPNAETAHSAQQQKH